MPNPLASIRDYLRGEDLKQVPLVQTTKLEPTYQKALFLEGTNSALLGTMLVHGPGATDIAQGIYSQDGNSAVFACLDTICTSYPEAPAKVWRVDAAKREWLMDHPMQGLLDQPNPDMDAEVFWYWVQWAKHCDGNAYVRKLRSGDPNTGNVVQLWPISPRLIEPKTEKGSGQFISFYRYHYDPGHYEDIPPHNMIHFRLGLNDADMRLGLSPFKRLVMEVATDQEATRFSDALLKNYGVPGLVVTVPSGTDYDAEKAAALKERIGAAFGNQNRGNVGVLSNGATMSQFGFNPVDMDLKALHRLPEERIAAVLNVPAILAGLGAGLDRATYNNVREAGEIFTERKLIPMWRADAGTLNLHLRNDFTSDKRVRIEFDISDVRALQEDEDKKYARLSIGVRDGWIDPDEARADVGLPPRGNPAPAPAKSLAMALYEAKAKGDFSDYPALLDAMVELARPGLEADLDEYFSEQRKRLKRRVLEA